MAETNVTPRACRPQAGTPGKGSGRSALSRGSSRTHMGALKASLEAQGPAYGSMAAAAAGSNPGQSQAAGQAAGYGGGPGAAAGYGGTSLGQPGLALGGGGYSLGGANGGLLGSSLGFPAAQVRKWEAAEL